MCSYTYLYTFTQMIQYNSEFMINGLYILVTNSHYV